MGGHAKLCLQTICKCVRTEELTEKNDFQRFAFSLITAGATATSFYVIGKNQALNMKCGALHTVTMRTQRYAP